jgi:putative ABC transport system permease protein
MLVGIAWRNIWRNKKRSIVMLTAIALGLCGGLFATGVMIGMADSMVKTATSAILRFIPRRSRQIHSSTISSRTAIA